MVVYCDSEEMAAMAAMAAMVMPAATVVMTGEGRDRGSKGRDGC